MCLIDKWEEKLVKYDLVPICSNIKPLSTNEEISLTSPTRLSVFCICHSIEEVFFYGTAFIFLSSSVLVSDISSLIFSMSEFCKKVGKILGVMLMINARPDGSRINPYCQMEKVKGLGHFHVL